MMKIADEIAEKLYLGTSKIPNAGLGLFAFADIKCGADVCEYKGDVFDESEVVALLERYSYTLKFGLGHPVPLYALKYPESTKWIDVHPLFCTNPTGLGGFINDKMGIKERTSKEYVETRMKIAGIAKTMNDPKYETFLLQMGYNLTYYAVPYQTKFRLRALRDIKAGEELYLDYGDRYWEPFWKKNEQL